MEKNWIVFILITIITISGCSESNMVKNESSQPQNFMTPKTVQGSEGEAKEKENTYMHIEAEEAKEIMDTEEGYLILDVRTQKEFETGRITGAVCLPNEEITDKRPEILPDLEQKILVYCRSGSRSKQAALKLAEMGYENVLEFGGINDWPYEIEK